jgi:hypothetical protein
MRISRRNSLYAICLGLVVGVSCDTSDSVEPLYREYFIKYYGEDGNQEGKDLVTNSDGSIIILGNTIRSGLVRKMFVVKTDTEGNVIWEKSLGSNLESGVDIEAINAGPDAGNFIILSNVTRNVEDSLDIRLTVISPDGDSLKSLLINRYESQEGKSVTSLADGSYFVVGKVINADTTNVVLPIFDIEDVLVIRVSSLLVPSSYFRMGGSSLGLGIKIFDQGSYYNYAGYSDELIPGESGAVADYETNFVFRRFNTDPTQVATVYAGTASLPENMTSIAELPSGIFMAIGTEEVSAGISRIYATTINDFAPPIPPAPSPVINEGTINSSENLQAVAVSPLSSNRFLVLGNKVEPGGRNMWLARVDLNLATEFEVVFGGPNNDDTGSAVAELPNGDILVLGTMNLTNQNKIALIKLKSNGQF